MSRVPVAERVAVMVQILTALLYVSDSSGSVEALSVESV